MVTTAWALSLYIREICKAYYEKDGGAFGSTHTETYEGVGSIPMHLLTILGGCRKHIIESNESLPIIFLALFTWYIMEKSDHKTF